MIYARYHGYALITEPEEQEERIQKCNKCPYRDSFTDQCDLCSCFIFAKTQVTIEECPKEYWLAIWRKKQIDETPN